jgi:hypothetical protein
MGEPRPPGREPMPPIWDRVGRGQRRLDRIQEELERNRRGDYKVPTWVLVLVLLLMLGAWAAVVIFA